MTTFPISADVYYHTNNGIATGLQEVSVANFNNQGTTRRGIVISRGDPTNFPNRADRVTGINLNTGLKNLLGTGKQTTCISFVPQRTASPADDPNQQFFFRVKVLDDHTVRLGLKRFALQ